VAVFHQLLEIGTDDSIGIYDVTAQVQDFVAATQVQAGQVLIFLSPHHDGSGHQ
jgi:thiamine phosphate synthase YjbQ (UPF0047 family)